MNQSSAPRVFTPQPQRLTIATASYNTSTCIPKPRRSTTRVSFPFSNDAVNSRSTARTLSIPSIDTVSLTTREVPSPTLCPPAPREFTTAIAGRFPPTHTNKRRRTSTNISPGNLTRGSRPQPVASLEDAEVFAPEPSRSPISAEPTLGLTTIDLTGANDVPKGPRKPEKDGRVKIAAFQCVICLDGAVNLTVTHCGHLYCVSCLHQSLHAGAARGKCPMCRQEIDVKSQGVCSGRGFWPLELKLMKDTRRGKRKADALN